MISCVRVRAIALLVAANSVTGSAVLCRYGSLATWLSDANISAFHSDDLLQRVDVLNEVVLRLHECIDVLVGHRHLVAWLLHLGEHLRARDLRSDAGLEPSSSA